MVAAKAPKEWGLLLMDLAFGDYPCYSARHGNRTELSTPRGHEP